MTIPFGVLIALLGAWAFFVPLVGPYFNFGFSSDEAWQFSAKQWELQLAPGAAAFVGGVMLVLPGRLWNWLGGALALVAGLWLVVGPSFYPVFSSGTVQPYGSEWMQALRWIGHFYAVGALILYFAGWAHGLLARRRPGVVAEPSAAPEEPVVQEPAAATSPEPASTPAESAQTQ
jgi:hypothetical protein